MQAFSFIHAADLHLDSPFAGLSRLPEGQERIAREVRDATFAAFDALIDLCIDKQVDFLLVAGDVYDGAARSLRAQLRFRDGMRRLDQAGIRAFVAHGNHDPLDGWADSIQMPAGVHTFGPDVASVVLEKQGAPVARIHGISYPTRKIGKRFGRGFSRAGDEAFQIGVLHCNAGGNPNHDPYAPRTIEELVAAGLDYWALGHIHESIVLRQSDPFIGYAGNTQGRHINESGPRGCFLVQVDAAGRIADPPQFIALDRLRWARCEADIAGTETMDALIARLDAELNDLAAQAQGRSVLARITLCGRGPLHRALNRPGAAEALLEEVHTLGAARLPFVWVEKLAVRTRPELDLASRREARDFLGDVLRLTESIRNSPEEMDGLRAAIADLYENKRAGKTLTMPDDDTLRALLDRAETRCVDLFSEEDD